jgi:hypothetical protein
MPSAFPLPIAFAERLSESPFQDHLPLPKDFPNRLPLQSGFPNHLALPSAFSNRHH